jgi:hypothetical protein
VLREDEKLTPTITQASELGAAQARLQSAQFHFVGFVLRLTSLLNNDF